MVVHQNSGLNFCLDTRRQLQSKILGSTDFDESADSMRALSYINDPVAVPYLEAVLKSRPMFAGPAINGLEQIGNEDAIRVLTAATKSKDRNYTTILAKQALDRMKTGRPRENIN